MSADRLVFALDVPELQQAQKFVELLEPHVGAFKVGLELFIASGSLPRTARPIVLDLKLHDIPETVERAIVAAAKRGASHVTLHVQQEETLRRAAKRAKEVGIVPMVVTLLTSMTSPDCRALGINPDNTRFRVLKMAQLADGCGIGAFVCSPLEVGDVRSLLPKAFLMVPGVRPQGSLSHDQQRTGTPRDTVQNGADWIVVGRPIRDASNLVQAAIDIAASIQQ